MSGAINRRGNRMVLAAGALTAVTVLFGVQGCQRQSPRFDHDPSPSPAITAKVDAAGNQAVTLQMTDTLRFVPSAVVVHPGKVTMTLANAGGDPHTFEVPALNVNTGNIPGHQTETITFTVPKGPVTYAFDCAYHTSEHMVGTITVLGS
jgi:plastocyanin